MVCDDGLSNRNTHIGITDIKQVSAVRLTSHPTADHAFTGQEIHGKVFSYPAIRITSVADPRGKTFCLRIRVCKVVLLRHVGCMLLCSLRKDRVFNQWSNTGKYALAVGKFQQSLRGYGSGGSRMQLQYHGSRDQQKNTSYSHF